MSERSWGGSHGSEGAWDDVVLGDMHLNSAINLDLFKHYYGSNPPEYRVKENRRLIAELGTLDINFPKGYKRIIGFQRLFCDMFQEDDSVRDMDSKMTIMIMKIITESLKNYSMNIPLSKVSDLQIIEGCKVPRVLHDRFKAILLCIYARSEWIRSGEIEVKFGATMWNRMIRMTIKSEHNEYIFTMGKEAVEIRSKREKRVYVADFSSMLLLLDVSGQRICAHLCSKLGNLVGVPGSLSQQTLSKLCTLGDTLIDKCGNRAYELLGMFEALCVGSLLKENQDEITDGEEFLGNCMTELKELVDEFEDKRFVNVMMAGMISELSSMEARHLSNAFCLYRIWGHPTVDIKKGMTKVYELGTKKKDIPPLIGKIALCQFRKMFMSTYLKKHGTYPPHSGVLKGYVGRCIEEKVPIRVDHPGYNVRDFEEIILGEAYRIPETYDMCHILNDKAVSPTLSELRESIRSGKGTNCGAKRRGILRWMEGESMNCREFLLGISEQGLPDEDLLIGMYEKEREIKVAARMYSLMTEKMRYYFVLTEGLIADHILPHFPQITMKDSLNVLLKKMWESGGQRSIGTKDVNINIDFSKWNTNMRDAPTRPVFSEMDRIFGLPGMISRTHEFFERSLIYSASGKYLPRVVDEEILIEPPMCYKGHVGGFEGLRQKGWTVYTVCLLAYLSEQQRVGMNLMGQGDNQIIRLKMPVSYWSSLRLSEHLQIKEARIVMNKFVSAMDTMFAGAGLPIKVRETWKSSRLFMYGKVMLLDGRQLPQWYKKTLRSYALSNEGTLTISGVIGTIATNMCAAGGGSETPCLMYLFFLILAEWSLSFMFAYHPFTRSSIKDGDILEFNIVEGRRRSYKSTKRVNSLWLKALLVLVPTAVGGSVTIPLTGFIMRGFPDKASEGYAWLKFLGSTASPLRRFLLSFYSFMPNDTIEADMLVQSPFSINHKRPPTPGLQTRENIREWMLTTPRFQQNRFIKGMKELLDGFDKKSICRELLTPVIFPLITHEVYETFGQVYCEGICDRVESTRTIRTMHLNREDREPIICKLMEDESSYIGYMWWRAGIPGEMRHECATKQAREARNVGWGVRVMGVTTPHPLEVLFQRVCTPTKECKWSDDHILSKLVDEGQFPPFLGSKIKTKVYSLQDEEARREPLIKTGARLARQFNWIDMGPNMRSLVMKNVKALCNVSVFDKFVDDDPTSNLYTGSVMHRFTPASVSEGCFINYAPQVGHRVFMSSDTLPSLSRGDQNKTFHFQAMYCFLQYTVSNSEEEGSYHHHVGCSDCVVPVEDAFDDIPDRTPHIDKAQEGKYTDIIRTTLGYISEKPRTVVLSTREPPAGIYIDNPDDDVRALYAGMLESICWRSAAELLAKTKDTYTSVGTEDLQGWPRIYAYKLSRKQIIAKTSVFIMFQVSSIIRESPSLSNLERIRRRAIDMVSSVGVDGFSGIASLCLGRDCPDFDDEEVTIIEGFSYPETVRTCLSSVKASILLTIGKLMTLRSFLHRRCIYPTENMGPRDFFGIISCKCTLMHGCTVIQDAWETDREMSMQFSDIKCSHGCLIKMLRKNLLINMTMDRAMKYLPVLGTKTMKTCKTRSNPPPLHVKEKLVFDRVLYSDVAQIHMDYNLSDIDMSSDRLIQYPTSSVYKWCDILSYESFVDHIVVLGDGTGGTSMVAAYLFSESNIYPMALLESKNLIPQDTDSMAPPMSRHYPNVKLSMLIDLPDDIRKKNFATRLTERVNKMNGKVRIVSDIEGSGGMLSTIFSALSALPEGTELIIKTYVADLCSEYSCLRRISKLELLVSPLGNLRYGEIFLKITLGSFDYKLRGKEVRRALTSVLDKVREIDYDNKISTMSQIEKVFSHASNTSINICIMRVAGWGGAFPKKVLTEENMKMIGYVYQYINTHYHFASTRYRPGDGRTITPMRSENLTKLMSSFLLGVFGEMETILEEISKMCLIGDSKGLRGREYFKVRMILGSTKREITPEEIKVGRIIRNYRVRECGFKVEHGPIGLPFESGSLSKIKTWGYKVPISVNPGWIEEYLQI